MGLKLGPVFWTVLSVVHPANHGVLSRSLATQKSVSQRDGLMLADPLSLKIGGYTATFLVAGTELADLPKQRPADDAN